MNTPDLALGAIWYLVFLFSTTCHEAAHALVAKLGGDTTAAEGGQVTLNPIPHIRRSPFGMVVVPILSFLVGGWMIGWASAPFNPEWQRQYPRRSAWMALAGPAANFTLMLLAGIAIRIGLAAGYFRQPEFIRGYANLVSPANAGDPTFLTSALSILFILNLLLGTFNLLPVPPLDGHAGIMVVMPEGVAQRYIDWVQHSRNFALLGLIIAWSLFDRIFQPVFSFALRTLYAGVHNG
jgi:Zn-dependent protease